MQDAEPEMRRNMLHLYILGVPRFCNSKIALGIVSAISSINKSIRCFKVSKITSVLSTTGMPICSSKLRIWEEEISLLSEKKQNLTYAKFCQSSLL
jgi:hypothetical protein